MNIQHVEIRLTSCCKDPSRGARAVADELRKLAAWRPAAAPTLEDRARRKRLEPFV